MLLIDLFRSKDERVVSQSRKIGSEGFILVFGLLFISFIIKTIFFEIPFHERWTEYAIMMTGAIYVTVRHVLAGSFTMPVNGKNKPEKKIVLYIVISIAAGLLAGLSIGIRNYFLYDFNAILILLVAGPIFCITAPIIFVMLYSLEKASIKRAEKMSGSDDEQ